MKLNLFTTLLGVLFFIANLQTTSAQGPGGIGSTDGSSSLELWLRADQGISTIDGKVQTWADLSGNGRNLTQSNSSRRPTYNSADPNLNERPVVDFVSSSSTILEGVNTADIFGLSGNEPTNIGDIFVVFKQPTTNSGYILHFPRTSGNGSFLSLLSNGGNGTPADTDQLNDIQAFVHDTASPSWEWVTSEGTAFENIFAVDSYHLARFGIDPTDGGTNDQIWLYNNDNFIQEANTNLTISYNTGNTGDETMRIGGTNSSTFYDGEIAEIFIYSERLNDVQFIILQNYINARYGLSTSNDLYAGDEEANFNHDEGIFGIGRADASNLLTSANLDGLSISSNTGLDDGDYLLAGYRILNNSVINNDINGISGSNPSRTKRIWYLDKTDANTALRVDITFDLDDLGLQDATLATSSNYVLVSRSGVSSGAWNEEATATTINDANNTITFENVSITDGNFYTLATTESDASPLGDIQQTWYSFQSGSWGDPNTWTLDGATTPLYDNDDNQIPGSGDNVVITAGRSVNMYQSDNSTIYDNATTQSLSIRSSARLNLLSSTGNDFGAISGSGTLAITGYANTGTTAFIENLPEGDYSDFADQLIGGIIELNTGQNNIPLIINQDYSSGITTDPNGAVSRTLTVNMGDSDDKVVLQHDLYLTRNLNVTQGELQIHRDNGDSYADIIFSDVDLSIDVIGNVTISSNGYLTTGTSDQRHQFNSYGNFTNNGFLAFTQRTSATYTSDASDGITDLNFLNTISKQTLACNGVSNFYRIEIDKSSPAIILEMTASVSGNFNLYGRANYNIDSDLDIGDTNNNAFALITGTAKLGSNIEIPTLNTTGNYAVSSLARLWIDGGWIRKTGGTALVPYGTLKISSGLAEFLVQSGITMRDAGAIEVEGGILYANQIRTSVQASNDVGSYVQTGGSVFLNGGSGIGSSTTGSATVNRDYYVFNLTQPDNVFRMSGGTLEIQRSNYSDSGADPDDDTDDLGGGIFINSDPQNIEVTGGTVIMNMNNTVPFKISSKAPFYNVIMTNSGGAAIVDNNGGTTNILTDDDNIVFLAGGQSGDPADASMTAQPLVVLNDLTIGDGTNPVRFDHLGQNINIGRNLTIEANAELYMGDDALLPINLPGGNQSVSATHQNTVTFDGTIASTISLANLIDDGEAANEQLFHNLVINKPEGTSVFIEAPNKGTSTGNETNALRIAELGSIRVESGILDQGERSIRLYGDVYNASVLGVFEPGVTSTDALIKFRTNDLTIDTEPDAVFGNFRMFSNTGIITLENDVTIKRLLYNSGRIYIGSNNLTVEELDIALNANQADFLIGGLTECDGCFSVEDMIITDGNASDGGLSIKITSAVNPVGGSSNNLNGNAIIDALDDDDFLFPLGIGTTGLDDATSKYTPVLISLASAGDLGSDGEAYITVNPVQGTLQTTDLSGGEVLDYYWRIRTSGFDVEPDIDFIQFFGNDDDVPTPANLTSYVSGKVLDAGTYTRSSEANTVSSPASPDFETTDYSILFDGDGGGFVFEEANFTAGDAARFVGAPQIFYSINSSPANWTSGTAWSLTRDGASAGDYPQLGDVAVLTRDNGGAGDPTTYGAGVFNINNGTGPVTIAELVFDDYDPVNNNFISGCPRIIFDSNGSFAAYNSDFTKVSITEDHISGPTPLVSQGAVMQYNINGSYAGNFPGGDFSDFNNYENALVIYTWDGGTGTATLSIDAESYPSLWFEGGNLTNRTIYFPDTDVTIYGLAYINGNMLIRANNSANERTLTFNNGMTIGSSCCQTGYFQIDGNSGADQTIVVNGDILFDATNPGRFQLFNNSGSNSHLLQLNGNINVVGAGIFNLGNGTNSSITLELTGEGDHSYTSTASTTPQLYRVIMNKGEDSLNTFTFNDNFSMPDPADIGQQPFEIVNGTLIFDDAALDILLTDASTGDFYLPNPYNSEASSGSGAIEVKQGIIRIEGDDTGLVLDGTLTLSGGDADFSDEANNGNNFIEYSATGYANINITNAASTLSVGSQMRRGFYSEAGILELSITDGALEIGSAANGDYRRGMLEILNSGSSFTHTGGTITFYNQNGASATDALKASLLLEPETYDISGSTINIDLNEADDDNFSINSAIPLNNLSILSSSGVESEVVQLKTRSLTLEGDLTLADDIEFRSNNLDLILEGNLTIDDAAIYSAGINQTTFDNANSVTIGGTNTSNVEFYNFEKTGIGTLTLDKNIEISGSTFDLTQGVLNDNGNTIDFLGQSMTNNATHTSPSNQTNGGVVFKRSSSEQFLSTSGSGVFGNITIDNNNGVSLPDANQDFEINNQMTLSDGVLDIGPALMLFTSNATITNGLGSGTNVSDFGEDNQIQTNSSIIDFGVEKEFAASSTADFVFPVGEDNRYTPVKVDFTTPGGNSGSTVGRLRIRPRNAVAPIMLSESQAIQDAILQYHWLVNGSDFTNFTADLIGSYDDDVLGTDSEDTYRGARAIFSDPDLAVQNPFPDTDGDGMVEPDDSDDTVDDANNTITFPITSESDFSGEYFAGDPATIPDAFNALIFDANTNNNYSEADNYFFDNNDDGIFNAADGDIRQTDLSSVIGGAIELASGTTMSLNVNNVNFSRFILPVDGTLEVDGTNGHLLGQVSGSGTIRINSNGSTASLPAGDYDTFFDCASGGGALEYGGSGSYTIMVETNQVRQLTINGTGSKTFVGNSNISICEDFIVNTGTISLASDRVITIGGDFDLNGGTINMAQDGVFTVQTDVTLTAGTMNTADNSDFELYGNVTRTGTTINSSGTSGEVSLLGSSTQNITGDFQFANLIINNSASGTAINLTGGSELRVGSSLTLTDGIIATDNTSFKTGSFTIDNILVFNENATYTGGGSNCFVDGVIRKESLANNSSFTFPTGDGTTYAPIRVSEDASGVANWTARYIRINPNSQLSNNYTNIGTTEVSSVEFWVVYSSSAQSATIGLTYGPQSVVLEPTETTVVSILDNIGGGDGVDDSDTWEDLGRGGLSSGASTTSGTITAQTSNNTTLAFYTLGGQTEDALPVELLDFSARLAESSIDIEWSTASEINNDYFVIQRSADGQNFEDIGEITGFGTTNEKQNYKFIDDRPYFGVSYYRLLQYDFDGSETIYGPISVNNDQFKKGIDVVVYPNPTLGESLNVQINSGDENSPINISIVDLTGHVIVNEWKEAALGYQTFTIHFNQKLNAGIYLVQITQGANKLTRQLMVK